MELKLKYGSNFSFVNGVPTFVITDTIKRGTIEVEASNNENNAEVVGHKFILTRNGEEEISTNFSSKSNIDIDFENKPGAWSINAIVKVYFDEQYERGVIEEFEIPGNFVVLKEIYTGGGSGDDDEGETDTGGTPGGQSPNTENILSNLPSKIHQRFKSRIIDVDIAGKTITTQDTLKDKLDNRLNPKTTTKSVRWGIKYNDFDYRNLNTFIDFGNNEKSLIVNSQTDVDSVKIAPHSVILKTYDEIPDNVQTKQNVHIVQEIIEPIRETIRLYPFEDAELGDPILRQPTNQSIDYINNITTTKKSLNDIYTSDNFISSSLVDIIQSGSNSAEINVDYNDYKNFSTFGSVEKRLRNFKRKIQSYETYTFDSKSLAELTASVVFKDEIVRNQQLQKNVLNNFDHYEKYLYYQSSSANTSSFGLEFDTSWPKTNSSKPYTLADVTSSAATTWYNNNITSASLYDQNNPNRLVNLIPEHIIRDSENEPFVDFLDMIGHYYDNLLIYIKAYGDTYDRREKLTEGLSKDLIWTISDAFGWKQPSGKEMVELSRYLKGYQLSGSATSSTYQVYSEESEKDLEREVWGRVLTSMPYILKRKGTKESIQALVNAYGIPPTILKIREYGGADVKEFQPNFDIQQRFTRALDFKNSQYIQTQWKEASGSLRTPDTIEFRFRAASSSNQVLVAKDQRFAVRLIDEGSISDNKGKVEFLISSSLGTTSVTSSLFPVFNNEFWSVGITREKSAGYDFTTDRTIEYNTTESLQYNLFVKQYEAGRSKILYDSSTSMILSGSTALTGLTSSLQNGQWTASGDIFVGSTGSFGDLGGEFTGSLQELRYYNSPLTESAFNNHTRAPKSINGNHISASFTDLVFRLRLDDNKNLSTSSDLRNVAPDQTTFAHTSSAYQTGSAVGFTANTFIDIEQEEKALTPNIGYGLSNSKVRIEKNWITSGSNLSVDYRTEQSSYDTSPLDSNKLGVFLSPIDIINRDIIESLGDIDFDQQLGDPRDQYEYSYRGLESIAESYFQKYTKTNNFWEYMRLIKYYDQSIFDQIKKVIPARVKSTLGLLIEPSILQRQKEVIGKPPSIESLVKEAEINIGLLEATQSRRRPVISATSSRLDYSGVISESFVREPSLYLLNQNTELSKNIEGFVYKDSFARARTTALTSLSSSHTEGFRSDDLIQSFQLDPFVSSSRFNDRFEEKEFFYTSSAAVGTAGITAVASFTANLMPPLSSSVAHAYSSSLVKAEVQRPSDYSIAFRRNSFEGVKNTIDTTTDNKVPFLVSSTGQTAVLTRDTGTDGKRLEVVRKK